MAAGSAMMTCPAFPVLVLALVAVVVGSVGDNSAARGVPPSQSQTDRPCPIASCATDWAAQAAVTGSIPQSVLNSTVTWLNASWPGELGSMPLGNGIISANVWVEESTGDLMTYIAHGSAFDINGIPVKVARHRYAFDPPLWSSTSPPSGPQFFNQTLDLATASIYIQTNVYSLRIYAHALQPALVVDARLASQSCDCLPTSNAGHAPFQLTVSVEMYRSSITAAADYAFCEPRYETPDEGVPATALPSINTPLIGSVHRNYYVNGSSTGYFEHTLHMMGVPGDAMKDPFVNLTFSSVVVAAASSAPLSTINATALASPPEGLTNVTLVSWVHANQTSSLPAFFSQFAVAISKAPGAIPERASHISKWHQLWNRSFVQVSPRSNAAKALVAAIDAINRKYVYQRYLDLSNGREAPSAIKFNGQAWIVDNGNGPDYRQWGQSYWWQNTRQPYYNALASQDLDILRPMFMFYHRMLPVVAARGVAEHNLTDSAGYFPETLTQFGTFNPNNWGCTTSPDGPSTNTYIRYHTTGSLELVLLLLDDLAWTGDLAFWKTVGFDITKTVVEYYVQRFPPQKQQHAEDKEVVVLFPSQALETWQCPDPASKTDCVTNPSTDIAGLNAIFSRLFANSSLAYTPDVPEPYATRWRKYYAALPALPLRQGRAGKLVIAPGEQLPERTSNSENTELYAVHPFRLFSAGKPNMSLAQDTYAVRRFPCNSGWCQDVVDAAMLQLTDEAQALVVERALQAQAKGWRFEGFSQHYQDYEPSLDHLSFMRTALHYMLMTPLDDDRGRIGLFPSWPAADWDVSFKLAGPRNTTIEATLTNGTITTLNITPLNRKDDIVIMLS